MSFLRNWWLVLGSVALIAAATLLPFGANPAEQMPARWCANCGGMWLADAISNVLLFVPFGLALALRGRSVAFVACCGLAFSLAVELCQSVGIPPSRSPAIADVAANTLGAATGWILRCFWRRLCCTDQHRSAILAGLWWLTAVSISILTAAAAQSERLGTPTIVRSSGFAYAPGFGWYGGTPINARVSAAHDSGPWTVSHAGSGPIVAEADRSSPVWKLMLRSTGRDSASIRRAMFFLHVARDTTAELLIAQHSGDVDLIVRRRAQTWGLSFPVIAVSGVFGEQSLTDTVLIQAETTNRLLRLEVARGGRSDRVQLALTPAIGWTMIQTIVGVQNPLAPLIQLLWLASLFFPVAWWTGRTKRPGFLVVFAVGIAAILAVVAPVAGVAPFSLQDVLSVLGIGTAGTTLGWWSAPRYSNPIRG